MGISEIKFVRESWKCVAFWQLGHFHNVRALGHGVLNMLRSCSSLLVHIARNEAIYIGLVNKTRTRSTHVSKQDAIRIILVGFVIRSLDRVPGCQRKVLGGFRYFIQPIKVYTRIARS